MTIIDANITLLMPTLPSRMRFMDRACRWYKPHRAQLLIEVNDMLTNFEAMASMLEDVRTPFVAMCADDDFLMPRGLNAAVAWLKDHPDYAVAHGRALKFGLRGGQIDWLAPYAQRSTGIPLSVKWQFGPLVWTQQRPADTPGKNDAAFRRLWTHMFFYRPTAYSVVRTHHAVEAHQFIVQNKAFLERLGLRPGTEARGAHQTNFDEWGEFLAAALPVFRGKVKQLPVLYMVRQMHDSQVSMHGNERREHHPPIRRAIQKIAPSLFRHAQFRLRAWRDWEDFQMIKEFVEGQCENVKPLTP